jgi:hypothetical protein
VYGYGNSVRFPFGRYKGQCVQDVPTSYLKWAWTTIENLKEPLRSAVRHELRSRGARLDDSPPNGKPMPASALQPIIQTWYRRLCLQYHPDRGGSDTAMRVVNNARDLLMELLAR